ncbi:MAG: hypothetical protein NT080_00975 [Spirochaetes bacterium]|nr:hypothetical protein [Spirochaetota bacterium]
MKKLFLGIALAACLSGTFAQERESVVEVYRRNFVRASLPTKLDLLKEAAGYTDENMGPLYGQSLQFVLDNSSLLATDSVLREIATFTVRRIEATKYLEAAPNLIRLFHVYTEAGVRIPAMSALAVVGAGNATVVLELNEILATFNALHRSGSEPDQSVLGATVDALGKLGDGSSFGVLFSTLTTGYQESIRKRTSEALSSLKGDYRASIIRVIESNPPAEKAAALKLALETTKLSSDDRATVAESALRVALTFSTPSFADQSVIRNMRYEAVTELTRAKWVKATPLAVRNLRETITDYARGNAPKYALLEAVACLGAMGTNDAAQALTLYLEALNAETERGKAPDEQIALAVVMNLGIIGDKIAYDDVLYMGYLQYPDSVKRAARDALSKLR